MAPTAEALEPRSSRRSDHSDNASQCSARSRLASAITKRASASSGQRVYAAVSFDTVFDEAVLANALKATRAKPPKKRHPKNQVRASAPPGATTMQEELAAAQAAVPPAVRRLASAGSDVSMDHSPMSTSGGEPGPSSAQPSVQLPASCAGSPAPVPYGDSSDDEGAHKPPSPPKPPPSPPKPPLPAPQIGNSAVLNITF